MQGRQLSNYSPQALAYCSNLHPGESLAEVMANIENYFVAVRQQRQLENMHSGLWLSARAAAELQQPQALARFSQCLQQSGMQLTSLNGFPYGNFHSSRVKQGVYHPNWSYKERLEYTKQLARILAHCLPEGTTSGAISTLPLGYKADFNPQLRQQSIGQLLQLNQFLQQLRQDTGKSILVCLEMEPDCELETTPELLAFFQQLQQANGGPVDFIGVCFDVCHQGVLYEDIYQSLQQINAAGITIGKIQLSNAIHIDLGQESSQPQALMDILSHFAEPKFLHQVKGKSKDGQLLTAADLCQLLPQSEVQAFELQQASHIRVHFHVPLNAHRFIHQAIKGLHQELDATFLFLAEHQGQIQPHLEVETYSWQVLPAQLQPDSEQDLVRGIVAELQWVEQQLQQKGLL